MLLLDEATSAIDPETDRMMQRIIRDDFSESTVLTIAHRLNTILDSDKILVMSDGRVSEFGAPEELLRDEKGVFKGEFKSMCDYAFNHGKPLTQEDISKILSENRFDSANSMTAVDETRG